MRKEKKQEAASMENIFAKGHWKQLSVLFGLVVDYIVALFMGKVDLSALEGEARRGNLLVRPERFLHPKE